MNGRVTAVLTAYMVSLRQLGTGLMSRPDFCRLMLPHKLEKGKMLSIEGREIKELGGWEGEDCEIISEKLLTQKVATVAWLNGVVTSLNMFLGTASEQAEAEAQCDNESEPVEHKVESYENDQPEHDEDDSVDTSALDKAIKRGKKNKANRLFDEIEDGLGKKKRKAYKKQIKGI